MNTIDNVLWETNENKKKISVFDALKYFWNNYIYIYVCVCVLKVFLIYFHGW